MSEVIEEGQKSEVRGQEASEKAKGGERTSKREGKGKPGDKASQLTRLTPAGQELIISGNVERLFPAPAV